jgi:hypothetical protein
MSKSPPALKRPTLRGAKAIADYLGIPTRQAFYALEHGAIPAGKFLGCWIADPDLLDECIAEICSGKRPE